MSHHKVGKLVCLLAIIAGLGWSQTAAAATTERDRLQKMLRQAKQKLVIIDQIISELEMKVGTAKAEVEWRAAVFEKSGREEDRKALQEAVDRYQGLVQTLEVAREERVQILSLIAYLKAKLRSLGPTPSIGPAPVRNHAPQKPDSSWQVP